MHPEKDGMSKKFQPDRCQIDNNTDEWKYNQPDSNSLADVEKKNKNSHENKDCAHTENVNVGKFQSKDKLIGLVKGSNFFFCRGIGK